MLGDQAEPEAETKPATQQPPDVGVPQAQTNAEPASPGSQDGHPQPNPEPPQEGTEPTDRQGGTEPADDIDMEAANPAPQVPANNQAAANTQAKEEQEEE